MPREPAGTGERRVTTTENWPLPAVVVAYHITYDGHPDSYPLHLTSKILSDGESSRIFKSLVYEKGIAVSAFGGGNIIEEPNLFFAVALVQHGHTPEEVERALIAEFDKLCAEPVAERELQRAKNQFFRDYITDRESIQGKAAQLAHAVVIHHDVTTADGEVDLFSDLKVADVQRVARTYFTPENRLVLTILPKTPGAPDAMMAMAAPLVVLAMMCAAFAVIGATKVAPYNRFAAQVPDWPSEGPPRPLPSRPVGFPPYELHTLPNGMQVIVVMHHEQPEVSMRLMVRARHRHTIRPARAALPRSWRRCSTRAPQPRSAEEIADAIDSIGGAVETGAGSDSISTDVLVMKDSFAVGMDLLADMVRHPSFSQEEIDRQREQALSTLQVSLEDPDFIAGAVLNRLIYGSHPYGMPDTGLPASIARITRSDLGEFHQKYFAPNNSILAIVGDVEDEEAMDAAERVFGDWARQTVPVPVLPAPPKPARRIIVIDKPDAVQTAVRVGQLGVPRKTPDYMALNEAIRILGGEGSNRLFRVLRSDRGLTYSASADMNTMLLAGDFVGRDRHADRGHGRRW